MIQASPKIPIESKPLRIPVFPSNVSKLLNPSVRSSAILSLPSFPTDRKHRARRFSSQSIRVTCECPQVMICDDDPFETVYYQVLFNKSISFDDPTIRNEEIRLKIFSCGEDLIHNYRRMSDKCGCNSLMLVVTDYNMGKERLDGIGTAVSLRKLGYKGPIVLRTSDTHETLMRDHENFSTLLESKTVNYFLSKIDHEKTKETLKALLQHNLRRGRVDLFSSLRHEKKNRAM